MGYSKHGSIHAWPASSLELAEPEYVTDGQMVEIGPVKKHNHSVTSISIDELLDRLDSIEKRLQALEGKAKEGTSAQEREDTDYKLYGVICKKPGLGVYELAKELGWSSDKVYGSLRRLARDRWVMAVRDGRSALKIVPVKWSDFLTPEEIEEFKKGDFA